MLFDLRGRGRRNTIKVIYAFLAFLMGGSLVLLGMGGSVDGGLLDAITGSGSSSGDTGEKRYEKQEKAALATLKRDPKNLAAYESLISARVQLAGLGDNYDVGSDEYTDKGKAILREATQAWEQYEALDPPNTEEEGNAANRIAGAYVALDEREKLVGALEIFAEIRNATGPYQQLAATAYELGQTRKGDLAAQKAVELAPEDQKQSIEASMQQLKQGTGGQDVQSVTPVPSATGTAEASPTAKPKKQPKDEKK